MLDPKCVYNFVLSFGLLFSTYSLVPNYLLKYMDTMLKVNLPKRLGCHVPYEESLANMF